MERESAKVGAANIHDDSFETSPDGEEIPPISVVAEKDRMYDYLRSGKCSSKTD